jgi:hypothetical protein
MINISIMLMPWRHDITKSRVRRRSQDIFNKIFVAIQTFAIL